jgi:hypothetical protein
MRLKMGAEIIRQVKIQQISKRRVGAVEIHAAAIAGNPRIKRGHWFFDAWECAAVRHFSISVYMPS